MQKNTILRLMLAFGVVCHTTFAHVYSIHTYDAPLIQDDQILFDMGTVQMNVHTQMTEERRRMVARPALIMAHNERIRRDNRARAVRERLEIDKRLAQQVLLLSHNERSRREKNMHAARKIR